MFMNVNKLLKKYRKINQRFPFLRELCTDQTLCIGLCDTFPNNDITNNEVLMNGFFKIIRPDRKIRIGGGVCLYVKNNLNVTTHLQFSNATCEMLITELEDLQTA